MIDRNDDRVCAARGLTNQPLSTSTLVFPCSMTHSRTAVCCCRYGIPTINQYSISNLCTLPQTYTSAPGGHDIVHIPFPLVDDDNNEASPDTEPESGPLSRHPSIRKLCHLLNLQFACGYATLVKCEGPEETSTPELDVEVNGEVAEATSGERVL